MMTIAPRIAVWAAAMAILAGCAGGDQPHTFRLGTVELVDETGLVTAISAADAPSEQLWGEAPAVINPNGRLDEAVLLWIGSSCAPSTRLSLSGNALKLVIAEDPGPTGCEGTPAAHAVRMDLNRVVDVSSIDVQFGTGT